MVINNSLLIGIIITISPVKENIVFENLFKTFSVVTFLLHSLTLSVQIQMILGLFEFKLEIYIQGSL